MGYANIIPFTYIKSNFGTGFSGSETITNVAGDISAGTIKTLNYKNPINYAFAKIIVPISEDTSGATNYMNGSPQCHLELSSGGTTIDCGLILNYFVWTPASGFNYNHIIPLYTNIASSLLPDTTYTATIKDAKSLGNNLVVKRTYVEVEMFAVN